MILTAKLIVMGMILTQNTKLSDFFKVLFTRNDLKLNLLIAIRKLKERA